MKKGKVVLVGTGFVGMSMAYSMLNRGGIGELVLVDIDKENTMEDLTDGLSEILHNMRYEVKYRIRDFEYMKKDNN